MNLSKLLPISFLIFLTYNTYSYQKQNQFGPSYYEPTQFNEKTKMWLENYQLDHPNGGPRPDQQPVELKGWPLHEAASRGDIKTIRQLIQQENIDPNLKMTDWFDSEPLGWAASFGQLHAVIELIIQGADPIRPANKAQQTPLSDAVREKHQNVVIFLQEFNKLLKKEVSLEMLDWLKSYQSNHQEQFVQDDNVVEWFQSKGWEKDWPLQLAAIQDDNSKIEHLILKDNIDPNDQMIPWFNSEPLGWAASKGSLSSFIELIKLGANPFRAPNQAGNTPYGDAIREKRHDIVEFLEQYFYKLNQQKQDYSLRRTIVELINQ